MSKYATGIILMQLIPCLDSCFRYSSYLY